MAIEQLCRVINSHLNEENSKKIYFEKEGLTTIYPFPYLQRGILTLKNRLSTAMLNGIVKLGKQGAFDNRELLELEGVGSYAAGAAELVGERNESIKRIMCVDTNIANLYIAVENINNHAYEAMKKSPSPEFWCNSPSGFIRGRFEKPGETFSGVALVSLSLETDEATWHRGFEEKGKFPQGLISNAILLAKLRSVSTPKAEVVIGLNNKIPPGVLTVTGWNIKSILTQDPKRVVYHLSPNPEPAPNQLRLTGK